MGRSAIIKRLDNLCGRIIRMVRKERCQICCRMGTDVHHIIGRANLNCRWDFENLLLVCRKCHNNLHNRAGYAQTIYRRLGCLEKIEKLKRKQLETVRTEALKEKEREMKMMYKKIIGMVVIVMLIISQSMFAGQTDKNKPSKTNARKSAEKIQNKPRPTKIIPARLIGWQTRVSGFGTITEPIFETAIELYDPNDPYIPGKPSIAKSTFIEDTRKKTRAEKKNETIQNKIYKKNLWIMNRMNYNNRTDQRRKNAND